MTIGRAEYWLRSLCSCKSDTDVLEQCGDGIRINFGREVVLNTKKNRPRIVLTLAAICLIADLPVTSLKAEDQEPAGSSAIQEIVVTAQRREQHLEDVPITVTVKSGEQLQAAGVTSTQDLPYLVSGLVFKDESGPIHPSLRGVYTQTTAPGSDNPVAIYLDGVYQPNKLASAFDLPDVDRIEVLKGPQGTLFGRNATGGAIRVFTKTPSFDVSGDLSASVGEFDGSNGSQQSLTYSYQGYSTGPILADKVAGSLSFSHNYIDGYLVNDLANNPNLSPSLRELQRGDRFGRVQSDDMRAKVLWVATDRINVEVTGFYSTRHDELVVSHQPYDGLTANAAYPDAVIPTTQYHVAFDTPSALDLTSWNISAKADIRFDPGTLTATTSYSEVSGGENVDVDAAYSPTCLSTSACTAFYVSWPSQTFAQEFVFASNKMFGFANFVAGVNYYHDIAYEPEDVNNFIAGAEPNAGEIVNSGPIFNANAKIVSQAVGVFTEWNFNLTDQLILTTGIRDTHEKKTGYGEYSGAPLTEFASPSWNSVTPRGSIQFNLGDRSNIYFTYSEGFKSGILPFNNFTSPPAAPEKIKSYEIGYKHAAGRYTVNLSAFWYDYKNLQVQDFTGTVTNVSNAAAAEIGGLDFDGFFKATDKINIGLNFEYMPKANFTNYKSAAGFGLPVLPGGILTALVIDASGDRLPNAPRFSGSLTLNYSTGKRAGDYGGTALYSYMSETVPDVFLITVGASSHLNADFWYRTSDAFRVSLWGKNLTGAMRIDSHILSYSGAVVNYEPPRSIGVRGEYSF